MSSEYNFVPDECKHGRAALWISACAGTAFVSFWPAAH